MRLRRRLPPDIQPAFEAFAEVVEHVERGKVALTRSVPSTRFPGRPLADALLEFEEALEAADRRMRAWWLAEVEGPWRAAAAGLRASRQLAARVRLEMPDPGGFEGLIGVIGDLLAPLEAFGEARDAFDRLRTGGPGGHARGRTAKVFRTPR
jgi:hypothetical protein